MEDIDDEYLRRKGINDYDYVIVVVKGITVTARSLGFQVYPDIYECNPFPGEIRCISADEIDNIYLVNQHV